MYTSKYRLPLQLRVEYLSHFQSENVRQARQLFTCRKHGMIAATLDTTASRFKYWLQVHDKDNMDNKMFPFPLIILLTGPTPRVLDKRYVDSCRNMLQIKTKFTIVFAVAFLNIVLT